MKDGFAREYLSISLSSDAKKKGANSKGFQEGPDTGRLSPLLNDGRKQ